MAHPTRAKIPRNPALGECTPDPRKRLLLERDQSLPLRPAHLLLHDQPDPRQPRGLRFAVVSSYHHDQSRLCRLAAESAAQHSSNRRGSHIDHHRRAAVEASVGDKTGLYSTHQRAHGSWLHHVLHRHQQRRHLRSLRDR